MEMDFSENYGKLWSEWEVRVCILFSLLLQIFLIFIASLRKKKTKMGKLLRPIIWLAYLMADAVAMFTLGLLAKGLDPSRNNMTESQYLDYRDAPDDYYFGRPYHYGETTFKINRYNDFLAYWAPFLLLHLGGPDTITAFALEDNSLWLRHMLWLCVEVTVAAYIFVRSLPNNSLFLPTLFMFVAGTIRYVERTWALYLASIDGIRDSIPKAVDTGTSYVDLIDEYKVNKEAGLPTMISIPDEYPSVILKIDSQDEYIEAFTLLTTFKCLISDLLLNFNEIKQSRNFLLNQTPEVAFKIMDIAMLGFGYDILHTKAAVIHKPIGYTTRSICFASILVSFFLFWSLPKRGIEKNDVKITYALLGGAMVLEVIAFIYLIFSYWTLIFLENHPRLKSFFGSKIKKIITHRRCSQPVYVTQYNLIDSCVFNYQHFNGIEKFSKLWLTQKILDNFFHTSVEIVGNELINFIFKELKKKAEGAPDQETSKQLSSCRGSLALKNYKNLKWTVDEVEFVESILLWHIATDLLSYEDDKKQVEVEKQIGFSKVISNHMLYLLVLLPSMIPSIEMIRQIKFRDACEGTTSMIKAKNKKEGFTARDSLLDRFKEMPSLRTKMVLLDACYLYQNLSKIEKLEEKWKVISEVWVELLAYAAVQRRGIYHAKCLSTGGELLNYVWFFMAHVDLGKQYHVVSNAKVIVAK